MKKKWIVGTAIVTGVILGCSVYLARQGRRVPPDGFTAGRIDSPAPAGAAGVATVPGLASVSAPPGGPGRPPTAQAFADFRDWLSRLAAERARGTAPSPAFIAEGRERAAARRSLLLQQMRANPWQALHQSLRWAEWLSLPPEVRSLVEEPFSETADFEFVPDCRPTSDRGTPLESRSIRLGERPLPAFVYGRRNESTTKLGIPLQGIRLDDIVALWEEPILPLDDESLAAIKTRFPEGGASGRSWLTGEPLAGRATAGLVGGKVCYFNSPDELAVVAQALAKAEEFLGPLSMRAGWAALGDGRTFDTGAFLQAASAAGSGWTESPKRVLGIRLDFTPVAGTPFTAAELMDRLLVSSNVIRQMSYGKTWIVPTVTTQVLVLPHTRAEYEAQTYDLATDARGLAAVAGFNLANFDLYLYSYPPTAGAPGAAGGQNVFINGAQPASVIVHEFGHSYGLGHANSWQAQTGTGFLGHTNQDGSFIEHHEYGDVFDIMGQDRRIGPSGVPVFPSGHFSMSGKAHLNWIEPSRVIEVTSNNVYRIHRFDHSAALNNPSVRLALKIRNGDGETLWVGLRRNFNLNNSISTGAYLVWAPGPSWHRLLDATPLSQSNLGIDDDKEDAALPPNQTYTDPTRTVHITNLGLGGSAPEEYLDIQVTLVTNSPGYELFTDFARTTRGLTGSYVNQNLRGDSRTDWRQTPGLISGTRTDARLDFPGSGWGVRSALGLTGGTDADWDNFSVQWDGFLVVHRPIALATKSDDGSRLWIDLNNDAAFAAAGREFINNHWGTGQAATIGQSSVPVPPGTYRIRIQYEEGSGANSFSLVSSGVEFELLADAGAQTNGLTGSYVNSNLRGYAPQNDWRTSQTISGRRLDSYPGFSSDGWGARSAVGLMGGSDANWDNFSAQWDGYIRVYQPTRFATVSDDGSRFWVDLNDDGTYGTTAPEFVNNHWGTGQGATLGDLSGVVNPGTYRLRLQYEEGSSGNYLVCAGRPQVVSGVDVTFGFAAQTVTEATTTFNVDVYLSEPAPVPVIVTLQTGGTAGAGDCYLLDPSSRTLVFPPGEVARQVRLQLLNDALWEGQETFTLQFANYIGAVAGTITNFTLRINDSLPAPTAAFGNFSTSFQEAITSPSVPVQLSAPSAIPVKVSVAVTGGTATGGGVDYTLNSGVVYFEAGETQKNVSVTCVNDALDEFDETISFALSPGAFFPPDGYAGIGVAGLTNRTFTIVDDDTPPTANIQQLVFIVAEGQSTNAIIRLSKPSALNVAFNVDRVDGNAVANDIQINPPSLTFLPGETQKVVTVTALDDTLVEGDEGFLLTMTSAANVILGSPRTFYIRDGDSIDVAPEDPTGVGAHPGHTVRFRKAAAGINLNNVNDAEALLGYPLPDVRVSFEVSDDGVSVINYIDASTDTAPQGYFGADRDFHSVSGSPTFAGGNIDQAAMEARGYLYVPTAGNWNFIVRSDDGFRLRIGSNQTVVAEQFIGRAPGDTLAVVDFPQPGYYRYQLTYFEYSGGAQVELLAQPPFGAGGTNLVGSNEDGLLVFRDFDIPPVARPVREPFVPGPAGHQVEFRKSSFNQTNIAAAEGLFALSTTDARVLAIASDNGVAVINYDDASGVTGFFGNDRQIATPSLLASRGSFAAGGDDNFALRARGFLQVANPGVWSFVVNSDDGFQLRLGTNQSVVSAFPNPRGLAATTNRVHLPFAGFYPFELIFFEWGGGALVEFFAFGPGQNTPSLVGDPSGALRVHQTGMEELRLTITRSGNQAILRWPGAAAGFTLERASAPAGAATVWTPVAGAPTLNGQFWQQSDTLTATGSWFYRLRR